MMVCWETLQIFAASPVVNTVFMRSSTPLLALGQVARVRFRGRPPAVDVTAIFLDGLKTLAGRVTRSAGGAWENHTPPGVSAKQGGLGNPCKKPRCDASGRGLPALPTAGGGTRGLLRARKVGVS